MFALKKILAPIDFSERATGAIRCAEALAEHFESRLILLHVLPPPHYEFASMEDGGPLIHNGSEEVQRSFDSTCRKLYRFLSQTRH